MYMARNREPFAKICGQQYSEEDEDSEEGRFARKFSALLMALCSNYEILLVQKNQVSDQLF